MIVSDIQTRIMRQFGDESGAQITSADIFRWINDGMEEIARNNHLLETKMTADVVTGQSEYSLPNDCLELWSVRWDNYKLRSLSMEQFDEYVTNTQDSHNYERGNPQIYWLWQQKLNIFPVPDGSLTGGLTIYYSREPVKITTINDTPELPARYHTRIVEYCLKQAYELDEDYGASQVKDAQLNAGLTDMLEQEKWQSKDFYPMITILSDDSW
jgi:hypothetical protein